MKTASISLGHLEAVILLNVKKLQPEAYGMAVLKTLQGLGVNMAYGSVHVVLDRLVDKGCLTSMTSEARPMRGGRTRRFYQLEEAGKAALLRHAEKLADQLALLLESAAPESDQTRLVVLQVPKSRAVQFTKAAERACAKQAVQSQNGHGKTAKAARPATGPQHRAAKRATAKL